MFAINFIEQKRFSRRNKQWFAAIFILLIVVICFLFIRYQKVSDERRPAVAQSTQQIEKVVFPESTKNELKLLGTIVSGNKRWALISGKGQRIEKVQPGDLLGKEIMKVNRVTSTSVELDSKEAGSRLLEIRK